MNVNEAAETLQDGRTPNTRLNKIRRRDIRIQDIRKIGVLRMALAAWVGVAISAHASITFAGKSGDFSASATFDTYSSGGSTYLTLLLANTSMADVMEPSQVLTAVFWDSTAGLTPVSAILGPQSTVLFAGTGFGDGVGGECASNSDLWSARPKLSARSAVVGGEWAFKSGLSGAPGSAALGVSSSGLGLFGPGDLFPGANLQGPLSPGGLQYGITSAGDNPLTGNKAVTGDNALIQNSVLFTFRIAGAGDLASVSDVQFQYGTDLGEAHFPATLEVESASPVPEPGTFLAGALLLLPIGLSILRRFRKPSPSQARFARLARFCLGSFCRLQSAAHPMLTETQELAP